jgi:diaminohydroxyphosphoribosylaminopyrimidine deaminase/5-amino-6-(5-phosphoribosylamino)uracil reductase
VSFTAEDHALMARAVALAARGRDTATPNPSVGCVIARNGRVIGEGWHARAGEAHAEAHALANCAGTPEGATVYVTLEPCSHHGRTPPCADALVAARVGRVVSALEDPNPLVKGKGHARLRGAGIRVESGLLADEARQAHRGFLARMARGRPWMRIKVAASLDGRIALANGESRWITGEAARRDVHAIRARSCAMLTGIGTVLRDDPELTVRHGPCERQPRRVVIDSRLDLPLAAKILAGVPPVVFTASEDRDRWRPLEALGAEVVLVPGPGGKTDLAEVARQLAVRQFNEVTVETGAKLNGSLLRAGVVDEIVLYSAPMLLGDRALGLFSLPELADLRDALDLRVVDVRAVGRDLRITALLET